MEEENAVRVLAPQRDYSFILTNMHHIIKLILRNLEICDLLRCKFVCSVWKDIVNRITRGKIYLFTKEIKFRYVKRVTAKPEIILRCLKLPSKTDINLIAEISNNHMATCSICYKQRNLGPLSNFRDDFLSYMIRSLLVKSEIEINSILNRKDPIDLAIFPTLPGVEMIRFYYHISNARSVSRRISNIIERAIYPGMSSVTERTARCEISRVTARTAGDGISCVIERLPKEDLKCILWFSSLSSEFMMDNKAYVVAGIPSIPLGDYINIGFAFHGNRIKAASMNLYEMYTYNDENYLHPSFSEKHIRALQKYKIDQSKCIAFMFSRYHKQCCENHTLLLFRRSFPDVPIMYYRGVEHYGYDFMPGMKEYVPEKNTNVIAATLVLVWYD